MAIFNRNDAQVKTDISTLEEAAFVAKYESATSATILRAIWKSGNKLAHAAPLHEPKVVHTSKRTTDDKTEVTTKKLDNGGTVVETEDNSEKASAKPKKGQKLEDNSNDGKVKTNSDKPGRTPRMRELIAELGKEKAAVKAKLDEEGFNTAGSGFHSEWNRVSKS